MSSWNTTAKGRGTSRISLTSWTWTYELSAVNAALISRAPSALGATFRKRDRRASGRTRNTMPSPTSAISVSRLMGGSKSCQNYCGYHSNAGATYYAVMPYPTCNGCLGGMTALDAITGTSSHELCEAITDPVPGKGWYDDVNGEIGDICAWNFRKVAGHTVQLEWSNARGKCA